MQFFNYKNLPRLQKVKRMQIGGPYSWTKFDADQWKIRGFMASSSWALMEADIYAYRKKWSMLW